MRELRESAGSDRRRRGCSTGSLGIDSLAALKTAARGGEIRGLAGFGEKSEQNILQGIAAREGLAGRSLLGEILPVAEMIRSRLAALPQVRQIHIAGSLRRMKETIGDIDIIVASPGPDRS